MKQAPAIGFQYRVSWLLVGVTVVVSLFALLALQLVSGPAWLRHGLHLLAIAYAGFCVAGLLRPRVRSVAWQGEGGLALTLNDTLTDGRRDAEGMVSAARVMGPLIVLTVRWPPRERAHLWLLPDNLDADTRRRLRMRLGAEAAGAVPSGNADNP